MQLLKFARRDGGENLAQDKQSGVCCLCCRRGGGGLVLWCCINL